MKETSEAKRKSYTGAFKLKVMHLLKNLGTRAGREYRISKKKKLVLTGLACRAMPLPCLCYAVWLSLLLKTGLVWPSSPAMLVDERIFCAGLSVRLYGKFWGD